MHTKIDPEEIEAQKTRNALLQARKEHIETKRANLIAQMNPLNEDMIAKQKKLYTILEKMVNNTHNHDLLFDFE
jgi:FtsZ-binding cell division protein ZapB